MDQLAGSPSSMPELGTCKLSRQPSLRLKQHLHHKMNTDMNLHPKLDLRGACNIYQIFLATRLLCSLISSNLFSVAFPHNFYHSGPKAVKRYRTEHTPLSNPCQRSHRRTLSNSWLRYRCCKHHQVGSVSVTQADLHAQQHKAIPRTLQTTQR